MASQLYSGTHAVDSTEWSCTTDTSGPDADTTTGELVLVLDVNDMIAGDVLQIRLYEKARSGDTQRLCQEWILTGAQACPLWMSPDVPLLWGWDYTLKTLAGTSITVLWSIRYTIAVQSVTVASGGITSGSFAAGAIAAAGIAAGALNGKGDWNIGKTGYALSASAVQAIWDALTSALTTVGSIGKKLADWTIGTTQTADVATVKTKTDFLPSATAGANGGLPTLDVNLEVKVNTLRTNNDKTGYTASTVSDKTGYSLSTVGVQAIWDALTSSLTTVSSIGKKLSDWVIGTSQTGDAFARLGAPAGASVSADVAAVKADAVTIKTVTNALPNSGALTSLATATGQATIAGYLDTEIAALITAADAIKAKTDQLAFTKANEIDTNVQSVNGTTVNGTGAPGSEWGP